MIYTPEIQLIDTNINDYDDIQVKYFLILGTR